MQVSLVTAAGSAAAVAVTAAAADWRRMHRADPDRVGFMPWQGVQAAAFALALVLLALACAERLVHRPAYRHASK